MVKIEITDTFAGEANYCWVNRMEIDTVKTPSNREILKRVREEFGITCKLRKSYDTGDCIRYDFDGAGVCMFVTFE